MGGASASPWKAGKKKRAGDKEWEELGRKVEKKIMREVKSWASGKGDEEGAEGADGKEAQTKSRSEIDEEWKEIGRMAEEKIKRKIRKWAEED